MDRRVVGMGLMSLAALAAGTGCNLLDKRSESTATAKTEPSAASALFIDDLKSDALSGAHTPGRGAGGWSSEAREIESHFNVR